MSSQNQFAQVSVELCALWVLGLWLSVSKRNCTIYVSIPDSDGLYKCSQRILWNTNCLPFSSFKVSWCRFLLNEFSAPSKVSSKCCFWLTRFSFFPVQMLLHDESCNEMELQGGVTLYGIFYLPVNYTELQKRAFYCILRSICLKCWCVFFFFSILFWRINNTKSKTKGGWKEEVMGRLWLETAFSQMHVNISQTLAFISREALCRLKNNILIITPVNKILF